MNNNKDLIKAWGNDDKRRKFLDAYTDWGVYASIPELGLNYYRYVTPNGDMIYAMEHYRKSYDYHDHRNIKQKMWETGVKYYIQEKDDCFIPSAVSISFAAALLMEVKKQLQNKQRNTK